MMNKKELRKQMRSQREQTPALEVERLSYAIEQRVLSLPIVHESRVIFVYVSIGPEVHTHGLIRAFFEMGKTVCVPIILRTPEQMSMHPCHIGSFADLKPDPNTYDILSPVHPHPYDGEIDLCIMPGVAFTERGDRLGMGGGFYDQYLASHPTLRTIALCYESQLIEALPVEPHDQQVQQIVTEQRVIETDLSASA